MGYDGQYTNADTGLIYLARQAKYDPSTAQFMSVDPKVEETGAVYEYANDAPLTNSDPTGTEPFGASIFGARELYELGALYRRESGFAYLGEAALEIGLKEAGEALGITVGAYAEFLLKWGLYFEKVGASLANARPGSADAYYLTESGFRVGRWEFRRQLALHTPGIGAGPGAVRSSSGLAAMDGNGK